MGVFTYIFKQIHVFSCLKLVDIFNLSYLINEQQIIEIHIAQKNNGSKFSTNSSNQFQYSVLKIFSYYSYRIFGKMQIRIQKAQTPMLKTRKTTTQYSRRKKTQQKIETYLQNQTKAQEQYCQTFEEYLCVNDLNACFNKLHLYLTKDMICEIKKNVMLEDGVYVLLDGNLTYVWTKNKHDRDHKDHLLLLARSGGFSNLLEGSNQRECLLASGYSLMISSNFAVVQADSGSVCTNQDCVFLKIPENVLEATQFHKLKAQRIDFCSKAKVPGTRVNNIESLIELNYNLHHTFKTKKLLFRNKIQVQSLGIITNGSAILRKLKSCKKVQLLKYCILLPNYQYEVSSAEFQMIEIVKNPTLVFTKPYLVNKFVEDLSIRLSCDSVQDQKTEVNKYCRKITNSISTYKFRTQLKNSFGKEQQKKKKQFSLFSKQNQDYWIVSMQVCKQNINNIKKYKKNISSKDFITKQPRILFNVSKKERKVQNNSDLGPQLEELPKKNSPCKNDLMERYSIYAKDMFREYRRYKDFVERENLI